MMLLSRSMLALALAAASALSMAQNPPNAIEVVTREARTTFVVAVPDFDVLGTEALAGQSIGAIAMNDLKLSGFFRPADNASFADETQRLDKTRNAINFAEWNRIGVTFLVKGTVQLTGAQVTAEVKTYDVVAQNYVFGKRYENYPVAEARRLAHQIADDIIKRLLDEEGNSLSRILFVKQLDPFGKTKQICVMDADGYGAKALTEVGELALTPAWGMHGTEAYYTTYKDFNPDLGGVILGSGAKWYISKKTGLNFAPAWSEARQLIALTLSRDLNSEIYTLGRDGQNLQRITNNRAIDSSPAWSRDGSRLAFTSDRTGAGSPQIWIKNLQGGEETRLTRANYADGASWSQAGPDRIAYAARVEGVFQIFICNPDGSGLVQLTRGAANNEDPSWAPNGLELVFASERAGRKQIFRMFADGSNVSQLTNDAASQSPAWSPRIP